MQIASAHTRNLLAIAALLLGFSLILAAGPERAGAKTLASDAAQAKKAVKKACKASKTKTAKGKRDCAKAKKKAKAMGRKVAQARKNRFFNVCDRGCSSRTVQEGADAAGKFQKRTGIKATVRIKPGTYNGEAFLDGRDPQFNYNGLTIMGVKENLQPASTREQAEQVVLDGEGEVSDAIEARSVNNLRLLNMYAKNFTANTFFVWAAISPVEECDGYLMKNLISSDTRSYGLFARNCFGGKMVDSVGWNHGDSAYYVGETPCDSPTWSNRKYDEIRPFEGNDQEGEFLGYEGPVPPCQKDPKWTILENIESYQNVLGYSGTNAKYVHIKDSVIYNNGAGLVPNTLDSERFEPGGWSKFTNNDIFWNNYNYYRSDSEFQTVSNGLGEIAPGIPVNYPIGIGVMLFGNDGIEVSGNRIFGHEKWGSAAFSSPVLAGLAVSNSGDDAKNLNNSFIDNEVSVPDANAIDFLNDGSGGGNCFSGNTAGEREVTFDRGYLGTAPVATVYPECQTPRVTALNDGTARSFNSAFGIQLELGEMYEGRPGSPLTVLGYAASSPAESMECAWNRERGYDPENPATYTSPLTGRTYTENRPGTPEGAPVC